MPPLRTQIACTKRERHERRVAHRLPTREAAARPRAARAVCRQLDDAHLDLELPQAARSLGVYRPVVIVGGLAYLSGHGPVKADGTAICGRLGDSVDKQAGYEAARQTGMAVLATLRQRFGSLDSIRRLLKTTGFVNATPEFKEHPAVINGFSELMRDVFGTRGGRRRE